MTEIFFLFSDGREARAVRKPTKLVIYRDADTPADGLELAFSGRDALFEEEPCGVRVEIEGISAFSGIVDEHTVQTEAGQSEEKFVCRSRVAALLDNEAMPGVLNMPSLRLMEKLYMEPYGFRAEGNDLSPKMGQIQIKRGVRCWAVLCEFAERFLDCTPHCGRDGAICFSGQESVRITLPKPKKLAVTRKPYAQISRVVVQNARTGAYSAVYENKAAKGVNRMRCLSAKAETAPMELIGEGEEEALQVQAVFPGFMDTRPGDWAALSEYNSRLPDMRVVSLCYTHTAEKSETEITFMGTVPGKEI